MTEHRLSPQLRSLHAGERDALRASHPRARLHAARAKLGAAFRRATAAIAYVISPDVSHYQAALSTGYTRSFVIFKATQGTTYLDDHFLANAGVATSLHAAGKLAGAQVYHVYTGETPAAQFAKIKSAIGPTPPPWLAGVMIDLESWAGTQYALHGDHSTGVNALAALLADWLGSWRRAWLYGNQYDLADLAPHRDPRMPVIVAAYTSTLVYKDVAGAIGQQYSDGETKWAVPYVNGQPLPRSTAPFGNCDHNYIPGYTSGFALRTWMGGSDNPGDDLPVDQPTFNKLMDGYFEKGGYGRLFTWLAHRLRGDHHARATGHDSEDNLSSAIANTVNDKGA